MRIGIKIIDERLYEFPLEYATDGSAGIDCRACLDSTWVLYPNEVKLISLGFALDIADPTVAALLLPRSGFGRKGLVLGNLVGLIDSDYQGELMAMCWNRNETGGEPVEIKPMDRIAQLMFMPIIRPVFKRVASFEASLRGDGGFGSTGVA